MQDYSKTRAKARRPGKISAFDLVNYFTMAVIVVVTLYPFWFCLIGSVSDGFEYSKGGVYFIPRGLNIYNYKIVFRNSDIFEAFLVTVLRTVAGTLSSVLFTALVAYGMSRRILKGRKVYMTIMLATMFFGGGLIPYYIVLKQLHLINTFMVYIIPWLFSVWNMIIFKAYFTDIPDSLLESARIDGAGEYRIFWNFIIPLSTPVLAAIALFSAVAHWNSFYDSLVFTSSRSLQTIQVFLYRIMSNASEAAGMARAAADAVPVGVRRPSSDTIRLATMVVTTLPVVITYPFLQKYFIKGIMIGSVKG